jgi:Protein of unknown function (DUF1592)/Protein of unknown function (DUF1588)/Protein of unknown function (DUF1595)/Protein of unknown function (DUF1587)/Protein of unknown function (DUF1585)
MLLRTWGISAALLTLGTLGCEPNQTTAPAQPMGMAGSGGGSTAEPQTCDARPVPGIAPLRPLTRFQYDNIVRDLLGDATSPASAFPPENEVDGYRTYAAANQANPLLVESYLTVAEAVAARAVAGRLSDLAPCAEGADAAQCAQEFLDSFGARAFRRPLTEGEKQPLLGLFAIGNAQSYGRGIELLIQAMLQSPQFLYRVDALRAPTEETGAVALGSYELAGRLSFTLWGSVPDEELLRAAAEGKLATPADVEREARRLLQDPRARQIVRDFGEQWLNLSRLDGLARDGTDLDVNVLNDSLRESLSRYLDATYFSEKGSFEQLFSSKDVWLNASLAPLYGGQAPESGFGVQTLPDPRSGLLTQPALLTLLSHSQQTAPVIRGVFVRERFLCLTVPPPPADLNAVPPDPDPNATTRERFRQHTEQEACSGCHQLIDGVGFGFERYDQLGRYRAEENGFPVDDSGVVVATGDAELDGPYNGLVELSGRIARSSLARDCLATNWYRYTYGRQEQAADECSLSQVRERFAASGGDLKELLVALTQTDSFLYRPALEAP